MNGGDAADDAAGDHRKARDVTGPELLHEVLAGRLNPSPILDLSVSLDEVAAGYAAMDQRQAIKVMVRP